MIFGLYAFILVSVGFLYLFVCVDGEGSGVLATAKRFFWSWIPNVTKAFASKICGERFVRGVERVAKYVCYEPNPIVQVLYFICAFGGFYVYVTEGFPHIPNARIAGWHLYSSTCIMVACYASYFMACWVDPGKVTKNCDKNLKRKAL